MSRAGDSLAVAAQFFNATTISPANGLRLSHLRALEAESIHILREVACEIQRPVMLYSIGKDSSVLLRLCQKAFYPGRLPFPLLHVDTSYKFEEMIEFRDRYTSELGLELLVYRNEAAIQDGVQATSSTRGIWPRGRRPPILPSF